MRKGKMNLCYMDKREMTYREVETKGYFTEIETKDKAPVTFFVYKEGVKWRINEAESNSMATRNVFETRKAAVAYITNLLSNKLSNEVYEARQRAEIEKKRYTLEAKAQ